MDPGSEKKTDAELELNTAEKLKEDDTESVGVTSEVDDSTKDVNGKEADSPYSDLVNVGSSFVYTVDRNKVDKNKNITKILAAEGGRGIRREATSREYLEEGSLTLLEILKNKK